jgi:hypothetical protein
MEYMSPCNSPIIMPFGVHGVYMIDSSSSMVFYLACKFAVMEAISGLSSALGECQGRLSSHLSRLYPSGHVFGPLLSSFRTKFTCYSKSLCKKHTKTSYITRYPLGTNYYKERGISTQSCPASGSAQNLGIP